MIDATPAVKPVSKTITPFPAIYGWVVSLEGKLDHILTAYFTTNYDQSTLFFGHLRSFGYTIAHHGHLPYRCTEQVKEDLMTLFDKYFAYSDVITSYKDVEGKENQYDITVDITVSDHNGDSITKKQMIRTDGKTFAEVTRIINSQTSLDEGYIYRQVNAYDY